MEDIDIREIVKVTVRQTLNDNDIREIVRVTVRETLNELFMGLGVDVKNPTAVQQDFAFIRTWRESSESVKRQGLFAAVGIVVLGVMGLIWSKVAG